MITPMRPEEQAVLLYAFGHLVSSYNPEDAHHADSGELGEETLVTLGLTGESMEIVTVLAEHVAHNYEWTGEGDEIARRIKAREL